MVKNLRYLEACVDEALRVHSTGAMGLARLAPSGGLNVCGQHFNEGSILSVPTYTVHHMDSVWGDGDTFRPERWLDDINRDEATRKAMETAYMPFSFGPRACVGRNVAKMELLSEYDEAAPCRSLDATFGH